MSTARTLVVYTSAANHEYKAARELRERGTGAIVPDDTTGKRRKVTAPRYVFADKHVDIAFAKHAKRPLEGAGAPIDAVMRMFCRPTPKAEPRKFAVDDEVRILSGPFEEKAGVIVREIGRKWFEIQLNGCALKTAVQPRNMIHIDPG